MAKVIKYQRRVLLLIVSLIVGGIIRLIMLSHTHSEVGGDSSVITIDPAGRHLTYLFKRPGDHRSGDDSNPCVAYRLRVGRDKPFLKLVTADLTPPHMIMTHPFLHYPSSEATEMGPKIIYVQCGDGDGDGSGDE